MNNYLNWYLEKKKKEKTKYQISNIFLQMVFWRTI